MRLAVEAFFKGRMKGLKEVKGFLDSRLVFLYV
jgi:hypothetical protein